MPQLTNERSVLAFRQYGEDKVFHYNGSLKSAKNSLRRNVGKVEIFKERQYTSCGFLKVGDSSINSFEERYF